jgi:hypothetical protein
MTAEMREGWGLLGLGNAGSGPGSGRSFRSSSGIEGGLSIGGNQTDGPPIAVLWESGIVLCSTMVLLHLNWSSSLSFSNLVFQIFEIDSVFRIRSIHKLRMQRIRIFLELGATDDSANIRTVDTVTDNQFSSDVM